MLGAISGDVLGSLYEAWSIKDKNFRLFHELDRPTDDSVLSLAVAKAILDADAGGRIPDFEDYGRELRAFGRRYPDAGYGGSFRAWVNDPAGKPYESFGNGSAMRASAVGWAFGDPETVLAQAELSAAPTHGHPEGIKGAQAVALAVLRARTGSSKEEIRSEISRRFGYDLGRTVDSIRPGYPFEVSCQASVPEAIVAFLDSRDWEDAVRNAVSLGGDADTQACIAGAIAEAFYGGLPPRVPAWVLPRLETGLLATLSDFAHRFLPADRAAAVDAETAARALPRGGAGTSTGRDASAAGGDRKTDGAQAAPGGRNRRGAEHAGDPGRDPRAPAPGYRVVLSGSTRARIADYARRLSANPGLAGARLRAALADLPVPKLDPAWLLVALLATKKPRIFAESEVAGDGSDWTRDYQEPGDDFSDCDLYSVVAWDPVSWPGNDYWAGARATDDGVKAAATDAMFALSGFRGRYDPETRGYLPPPGVRAWEDLVREHRLVLRAVDNVMVVGAPVSAWWAR